MAKDRTPPNKEDYDKFRKNYTGLMEVDRAYMWAATGDSRYQYRRDIFPGQSVNNLPSKKDVQTTS
jgi:hypothetical protein